ncbi:MAG: hypothetical protein ACK4PK_03810 [Alphaproteobacteria bacterium]
MSPDNVKSLEKEAFLRKLAALTAAKNISDSDFADSVYAAVTRFGLNEDAFRAGFGLSKGAVDRWTTLKNLPQPTVRPHVLAWIAAQLADKTE